MGLYETCRNIREFDALSSLMSCFGPLSVLDAPDTQRECINHSHLAGQLPCSACKLGDRSVISLRIFIG